MGRDAHPGVEYLLGCTDTYRGQGRCTVVSFLGGGDINGGEVLFRGMPAR